MPLKRKRLFSFQHSRKLYFTIAENVRDGNGNLARNIQKNFVVVSVNKIGNFLTLLFIEKGRIALFQALHRFGRRPREGGVLLQARRFRREAECM